MNRLLKEIEAVLRGEHDMHGEKMISVVCNLSEMAEDVRIEMETDGTENVDMVLALENELFDLGEEEKFDDGTDSTIHEYLQRLKEIYDRYKAQM